MPQDESNAAQMSVFALVKDIGGFFKIRDKARIDNLIFQAHYRFTTSIFFIASIIITAFTLIGDPIKCWHHKEMEEKAFDKYLDLYCWITHTYTLINTDQRFEMYKGVGPDEKGLQRYHAYYQWVPFMLFFHGLCFYLPHWIWKNCEGGKVKMMSEDIRSTAIADTKERREKREKVVDFLIATKGHHTKYAFAYFCCEILNLVNTVATMFIIDKFLGNVFMKYGLNVFRNAQEEQDQRFDPMIVIFPRITKCTLKSYGVSGSEQTADALCVLPLNNFNEKIYIFLWFWLIFLGCITFCAVAYSVMFLVSRDIRLLVITNRFGFGTKFEVKELIRQTGVGDFLLLHFLGQNLSTVTFHQLLEDLNKKLLYPQPSKRNHSYEHHYDANGIVKPNQETTSFYPTFSKKAERDGPSTDHFREPLGFVAV